MIKISFTFEALLEASAFLEKVAACYSTENIKPIAIINKEDSGKKHCERCGKLFEPGLRKKYCSIDCQRAAEMAKQKLYRQERSRNKPVTSIKCCICKKEFIPKGRENYCSDECRKKRNCEYAHNHILRHQKQKPEAVITPEIIDEVKRRAESALKKAKAIYRGKDKTIIQIPDLKATYEVPGNLSDEQVREYVEKKLRERNKKTESLKRS